MGFSSIQGQQTAIETLTRALAGGKVHHAYRFEGPDGVGKELAALRLIQALLCTSEDREGCESCSACKRALTFSDEPPSVSIHPDVIIVERGLYPSTSIGGASEASGISVEQIRHVVSPRIGYRPHEGRALCVLIRAAEELTVSAANALLKTLEEPPPNTYFILLTSRPGRLLDTILSRTLAVRFKPLPAALIATLLEAEGQSSEMAAFSGGSVSRALELSEPESRKARADFVDAARTALAAPHAAAAIEFGASRPEGRDGLKSLLSHLASVFASEARQGAYMGLFARRHQEVVRAITEIERNGTPALVLEAMILRLRATV